MPVIHVIYRLLCALDDVTLIPAVIYGRLNDMMSFVYLEYICWVGEN